MFATVAIFALVGVISLGNEAITETTSSGSEQESDRTSAKLGQIAK